MITKKEYIYIYKYFFPTFYMPTSFIIWTPRLFHIYFGIKLDHLPS